MTENAVTQRVRIKSKANLKKSHNWKTTFYLKKKKCNFLFMKRVTVIFTQSHFSNLHFLTDDYE